MTPLKGKRIIEFCEIAAGPFCGMLLSDMGAEVIKVERPQGDAMRSWPPINKGYSENFASLNRGKKSVVLDLKSPEGAKAARALIQSADAVIENFRPGVMKRNGIDYALMSEAKPKIVYASISAFGQSGPRATEGGFDLTMQAMAGVMSVTGEAGSTPVKCGVPVCDFISGLYAAFAVTSAFNEIVKTGNGSHVDVSMFGSTLAIAALQTSEYFGTGLDPKKLGSAHPRNAPYQAFKSKNGYFGMAAGNNKLWSSVCDVIGRPELVVDDRFINPTQRAVHQKDLLVILEDCFSHHDTSVWLQRFTEAGVPCSPINNYSNALEDPQVTHMGWVQEMTLPGGHQTKTFGSPLRINNRQNAITAAPPALGEHTGEVLGQLSLNNNLTGAA